MSIILPEVYPLKNKRKRGSLVGKKAFTTAFHKAMYCSKDREIEKEIDSKKRIII